MLNDKKRILIVGNAGAGKSTFSKFLHAKLGHEVFHLDKLFWKPNWEIREKEEWFKILEGLISKDKWIIEGNYSNSFALRALRADLIYFFDFSVWLCLYRIYKRSMKEKFVRERRVDLADGCKKRFPDRAFVKFVFRFNKNTRPKMFAILDEINFDKNNLVIFRSVREFEEYCEVLSDRW